MPFPKVPSHSNDFAKVLSFNLKPTITQLNKHKNRQTNLVFVKQCDQKE